MENAINHDENMGMSEEHKKRFMAFFEDVRAHLEHGIRSKNDAKETLAAIAFNAIKAIESMNDE